MLALRFLHVCSCCLILTSIAVVSAQSPAVRLPQPIRAERPRILPGTTDSAFAAIKGTALDAFNHVLIGHAVRLRDARTGHVAGLTVTDGAGLFAFPGIDPGNYVVELVDQDQTVLATTEILTVASNEVTTTVVRLPYDPDRMGALLLRPQAATVLAVAASVGVLTVAISGEDISPF